MGAEPGEEEGRDFWAEGRTLETQQPSVASAAGRKGVLGAQRGAWGPGLVGSRLGLSFEGSGKPSNGSELEGWH